MLPFAPLLSSFALRLPQDSTPLGTLPETTGRLPGFIGRVHPPPLLMRGWERQRQRNYIGVTPISLLIPSCPKITGVEVA